MTGQLALKLLIIAVPILGVGLWVGVTTGRFFGAFLRGAAAAVVLAGVLLALRLVGLPRLWEALPLPAAVLRRAPDILTVLLEEAAKLGAVLLLLPRRRERGDAHSGHRRLGAALGLGFASVEHLLFLGASIPGMLLRVAGAGTIHTLSGALYVATGDERGSAPGRRRLVTLVLVTVAHLTYNLVLQGLDRNLTIW